MTPTKEEISKAAYNHFPFKATLEENRNQILQFSGFIAGAEWMQQQVEQVQPPPASVVKGVESRVSELTQSYYGHDKDDETRWDNVIDFAKYIYTQALSDREQEAVEFAEWIFKQGYVYCTDAGDTKRFWMLIEAAIDSSAKMSGEYTTKELFELFKQKGEGK